ncbi:hypothetical protein BXZ70DRAFT_368899 [Cristinia sonorae]|uniref:HMG box domain-containing protein n=1 Tax=Cristinia sonorae TaxID=1940300 RepID=A0A8K0XMN3_9AGAR|nr:hypothetical protein BXZ70DRAFT_368899 [Cristinia sonorae]
MARGRQVRDSDHIPRPPNAFMVYRAQFKEPGGRERLAAMGAQPNDSQAVLSRLIGNAWHKLSQHDKDWYFARAERIKQEHKKLYPDYKFNPKSKEQKEKEKLEEKEKRRAVKDTERETKRQRTSTNEAEPSDNPHHLTYTQAAVRAVSSSAPSSSSPSSSFINAPSPRTEEAPEATPPPQSSAASPDGFDPSLDPSLYPSFTPSDFFPLPSNDILDPVTLGKRSFEEMNAQNMLPLPEDQFLAPQESISLMQYDYSSLGDFIQTLAAGAPVATDDGGEWQNLQMSANAPMPTTEWGDYVFSFGSDLPSTFVPESFLPENAPSFETSPEYTFNHQSEQDLAASIFDFSVPAEAQNIEYLQQPSSVASTPDDFSQYLAESLATPSAPTPSDYSQYYSSAPAAIPTPAPAATTQYLPPAGSSLNTRRRAGGTWSRPEFITGSSRHSSQNSQYFGQ